MVSGSAQAASDSTGFIQIKFNFAMAHEQPAGEDPEMTSPTPATRRRFCDLVRILVAGHEDPVMGPVDETLRALSYGTRF